jgi:hypothetical protein
MINKSEDSPENQYTQTLHPNPEKTNKRILNTKYEFIRGHLLKILQNKELTHTELMEELYEQANGNFEGGVQWYGETVKLDLEARQIIERTKSKPEKYRIKNFSLEYLSNFHLKYAARMQ